MPGVVDHRVALGREPPVAEHEPAAREPDLLVAHVAVQEGVPCESSAAANGATTPATSGSTALANASHVTSNWF